MILYTCLALNLTDTKTNLCYIKYMEGNMSKSTPGTEQSIEQPNANRRNSGCLIWLARGAVALFIFFIVLSLAGLVYQSVGAARDAREFPAAGRLVDIGGRNVHLYCTGTAIDGRPTVILETLSGGLSPYWAWVQPEVAQATRVCSYDRAGRGWSEFDTEPPTLQRTASDLRAALEAAGETGPYVMVGHSLGGIYVRHFAAEFADEVSGLVLVDSSHPAQFERFPELWAESEAFLKYMRTFPFLARLGLFRLYFDTGGQMDFGDLPERQIAESAAFLATPNHWRSNLAEMTAAPGIYEEAQTLGALGSMPLAVISAGQNQTTGWSELQAELPELSSNSSHVIVEDAAHASLAFNEAHARETSAAILAVVEAVKAGRPVQEFLR